MDITIPLRIRGITIGITISLPSYTIPLISPEKNLNFQSHLQRRFLTRPKVFIRQESEGKEGLVGDVEGAMPSMHPAMGANLFGDNGDLRGV